MAFAQEYDMEQWGSLVEVRAKQEVLEALCSSKWPLWGKAFAAYMPESNFQDPGQGEGDLNPQSCLCSTHMHGAHAG